MLTSWVLEQSCHTWQVNNTDKFEKNTLGLCLFNCGLKGIVKCENQCKCSFSCYCRLAKYTKLVNKKEQNLQRLCALPAHKPETAKIFKNQL